MTRVTQPLRDEHSVLFPHVDQLRAAADGIGEQSREETRRAVAVAHEFLAHHLIPHAEAEDAALYPVVGRLMGAPDATATMHRDHVEVSRLTAELDNLRNQLEAGEETPQLLRDVRRVLYGLYTLVGVHFAKEEEVYLPILDAKLTADEAAEVFRNLEAAAAGAHSHI